MIAEPILLSLDFSAAVSVRLDALVGDAKLEVFQLISSVNEMLAMVQGIGAGLAESRANASVLNLVRVTCFLIESAC